MEDHIVNASVSLEAAGRLLGQTEGESETYKPGSTHPTTATFVYRSITAVGVDWSELSTSNLHLARAIASNYNDVKHPSRGAMPPAEHTYVAGKVALMIVRLLTLRLADPTLTSVKAYGDSHAFKQYKRNVRGMGVFAGSLGKFEDVPDVQADRGWFWFVGASG
ncbi:hypothetical protein ACX80W_11110 [Arthrobacter sp. TMN-37]